MKYFPLVFENFPPHNYPLRQAELISTSEFWDYFDATEPMSLTEEDWNKITQLEQKWLPQLEKVYDLEISSHLFKYYSNNGEDMSKQKIEQMSKEERDELESKTKKKAEQKFLKDFKDQIEKREDLSKIDNPNRKGLVLYPEKIYQGLKEFVEFRKQIKQKHSNTTGLKRIIAGLYWQKIDYLFCWYTPEIARILASYQTRTKVENKLLDLITFEQPALYNPGNASQTVNQVDSFMWGIGKNSRLGQKVKNVDTSQVGKENFPFQEIKMNGQQAEKIARIVLNSYGLNDWQVELTQTQSTFSVNATKKKVKIPRDTERGVVHGLRTLAHEIEGHVLVNKNEKKFFKNLKLFAEHACDRFHPFAELPAIYVGEETVKIILGKEMDSNPYPYYLVCLQEKARGGDFKACFYEFGQRYIQEKGLNGFKQLKQNGNWQDFVNFSFSRTLRIFRNFTPLDDTSGKITYSKDMAYIEQQVIKQELEKRGLDRLFFAGHLNVYLLPLLKKIGLLASKRIETPKYVIARKIWPKIEKGLKEGKSLAEIILDL
jgi:hypothetical protein